MSLAQKIREKLVPQGSLREKLATLAGTAATAAANPIRAVGQAVNTLAPDTLMGKPLSEDEYNTKEREGQIATNRKMGYASDEQGNRTERLSREEREQLANEYPDMKNELLFEKPEVPQGEEPRTAMIETASQQINTDNVPEPYQSAFKQTVSHLNRFSEEPDSAGRMYDAIDSTDIAKLINLEGQWNPEAGSKQEDWGMSQLNASKRKDLKDPKTIWGQSWKNNFESKYGEFDEDNPEHQIVGAGIVLASARQKLMEAYKEDKIPIPPSREDIFVAYNMDYGQVIDYMQGKDYPITITHNDGTKAETTLRQQYQDYLEALKSKGF